ncbi:MAG: SIS domain-containing protein, partial [Acidobacteriota bacterium]
MDILDRTRALASESLEHHRTFLADLVPSLAAIGERTAAAMRAGGQVLFFGNGGSASQAQHLAAELVNRFERDRPGLPGIALTTDGGILTSIANDDSYERVFARQVEALARPGDVALGLTTSGSSPNVVAGLRAARERELLTVAFSGRDGGPAAAAADMSLV